MNPRMLDIGLPPHPWQATVKGNPVVISTSMDVNGGLDKASADGKYIGPDGVPHKIRKGDPIPDGATFTADASAESEPAPTEEQAAETDAAAKKVARKGPSETTDAAGPSEKA